MVISHCNFGSSVLERQGGGKWYRGLSLSFRAAKPCRTILKFRRVGDLPLGFEDNCKIDPNGFIRCQVDKERGPTQASAKFK